MSKLQIITRMMSQETHTSSKKYTRYGLDDREFEENSNRCNALLNANIFIDDTPALKISELKSKARKLKRDHNIEAIFIDYLQIMTTGEKSRGKTEDTGLISNSLKALAKELNIPVIALSQMSRNVDSRGGNRRPELSDLRNSGEIEQDADIVMFIHRDEYYGVLEDAQGNSTVGKGAVIVEKNRSGATDDVILNWDSKTTTFSNIETFSFEEKQAPLQPNTNFNANEPF
jgi:replicative DNA helicase